MICENWLNVSSVSQKYIMYLGLKVGLLKPSVEFAAQIVDELARAEGECGLRTEDEYCK